MKQTPTAPKEKKDVARLVLLILALLLGALLIAGLVIYFLFSGQGTSFYFVNNPVGIIVISLFALLLFLLIALLAIGLGNRPAKPVTIIAESLVGAGGEKDSAGLSKQKGDDKLSRFCMLAKIDEDHKVPEVDPCEAGITLSAFCDRFRNYSAGVLGLYYDIADIRRFVAALGVSRLSVLQGMSGTGKTSLPFAFGKFVKNDAVVVPIQPMWKERTDLLGYYNEFTRRFNETPLLEALYGAAYTDKMTIIVLDELNIARVEYYFAEFLSLLELPDPKSRQLDVVSDARPNDPKLLKDGRLQLPENVWFVGTANNDDSTFAISDKVYDRAMVLNLDYRSKPFTAPSEKEIDITASAFRRLVAEAKAAYAITGRDLRRINDLDGYLRSRFHVTFGNRIMRQIKEYVAIYIACGGTEMQALDDILSKKVLRKLESQNPVYVRSAAEPFCAYLDELFGDDGMPLCKGYLRHLEQNG